MTANTEHPTAPGIGRVGIVAKTRLKEAAGLIGDLERWLGERGVGALFDLETAALLEAPPRIAPLDGRALPGAVDLIVVLGGDGTFLAAADRIALAGADVPLLGVNFGSLGFLTEITLEELYPSLEAALAGQARIDERLMLGASVLRDGASVAATSVLNDVVVTKGALSRIIDLSVHVNDQFLARFRADGLIVASPTGSTAYNLAAGGPIVHPALSAMVVTPIAPHTLTNRPIVIPSRSRVTIEALDNGQAEDIFVTFDGQTAIPLRRGDKVVVEPAARPLRVIRAPARSYFDVLRQKLKWAER